jgi:hypothetical protein
MVSGLERDQWIPGCFNLWGNSVVLDNCGTQHAYINRVTLRNKLPDEADVDSDIDSDTEVKVDVKDFIDRSCQAFGDLPHTMRSVRSSLFHWLLVIHGWLCGMFLIRLRFHDVNDDTRICVLSRSRTRTNSPL